MLSICKKCNELIPENQVIRMTIPEFKSWQLPRYRIGQSNNFASWGLHEVNVYTQICQICYKKKKEEDKEDENKMLFRNTAEKDRHYICEIGKLFWKNNKQCYAGDVVYNKVREILLKLPTKEYICNLRRKKK